MSMKDKATYINDIKKVPAAACSGCGGWTTYGGMSQYYRSEEKVQGRYGCGVSHKKKMVDINLISDNL